MQRKPRGLVVVKLKVLCRCGVSSLESMEEFLPTTPLFLLQECGIKYKNELLTFDAFLAMLYAKS